MIEKFVVDPSGGGDARTISQALMAAPPGSELYIRAGEYHDELRITKPVRIVADGLVVLVGGRTAPTVTVVHGLVEIVGLTILAAGPSDPPLAAALIEHGALVMRNCTIRSTGSGVVANGGDANMGVFDCEIVGCGDIGALWALGANGSAQRTTIRSCGTVGVMVQGPGAAPTIRDCRVVGSGTFGITVEGGAAPQIIGCVIEDSGASAMVFEGESTEVHAEGNTVLRPRGHGFEVGDCKDATLTNNRVEGAVFSGFSICGPTARAELTRNVVVGAGGHGVQILQGAYARLIGNTVQNATGFGVVVGQAGSRARIEDNGIESGEIGVLIDDGAQAAVVNNRIGAAAQAVHVTGTATKGVIERNQLKTRNPRAPVVLVRGGADGWVEENQLWGTERTAISVGPGSAVSAKGNTVQTANGVVRAGILEVLNESALQ